MKSSPICAKHFRELLYVTTDTLIDVFIQKRKQMIDTISQIESTVKFTIGTGKRQFTVDKYVKIFVDYDIHHLNQIADRLFNYTSVA